MRPLLIFFTAFVFVAISVNAQAQAIAHADIAPTDEPAPAGRMILGATLGTLATVGAIYGINYAITGGRDVDPLFIAPAIMVSPMIAALGAHLGNRRAGGSGTYHHALYGALIGSCLGAAFLSGAFAGDADTFLVVTVLASPVLQAGGAALGSWLSHNSRTQRPQRLSVFPSLAPTRGGLSVSLGGLF